MASKDKGNKVVTYVTGAGEKALTGATQKQVEALRAAGRLAGVRRVRFSGR